MRRRANWVLAPALLLLLLGACSRPHLLTVEDYAPSRVALARGDAADALARFPRGEEGTFIVTLERTYLELLQGRPAIDELKRYANLLQDRFRIDVSRELRSFFYVETPEGYYASEHEVIWMHMLLSWGYSLRAQAEDACVESREASRLLSARWSEEGRFDDPMLRAMNGVLWAWCGSWEDAAIDFRRAAELDPSLDWARALGERDQPPADLFLVLGGIGPAPYWNPELEINPLRGVRQVQFRFSGLRTPAAVQADGQVLALHLTPGAAPWYLRHVQRDNAIHELIADSRYSVDSLLEVGGYTAKTAAGIAVGTAIAVGSIAGGLAVAYLAAKAGSGEGIMVGILIGAGGTAYGVKFANRVEQQSRAELRRQTDPAFRYRFVRFLPEYAWIGWSDGSLPGPPAFLRGSGDQARREGALPAVGGRLPRIHLGFSPDRASPNAR